MSDVDMRELERQARAGDEDAFKKLQAARSRIGFTAADAEYLHKYIQLCEEFIDGNANLFDIEGPDEERLYDSLSEDVEAELEDSGELDNLSQEEVESRIQARVQEEIKNRGPSKLAQLNEEYKYLVCPNTLKTEILARKLAGYDSAEGWAISSIC